MRPCADFWRFSLVRFILFWALAITLLQSPAAFAAEQELEWGPPVDSVDEIVAATEHATEAPPEDRPSLFPWVTQRLQNLPPFIADTQFEVRYRTFYLRRDPIDLAQAWAMGGSIYYRSGWLKKFLSVEFEGFTSQPIVAPDGQDGTLLLRAPGQRGYSIVGVANGKLRYRDFQLVGYRQKLNLPYLNQQDNRMTPNTFEAAKLSKQRGPLRFVAGYAWNFKPRNGHEFVSLSEQAGVPEVDRGAAFAGLLWQPIERAGPEEREPFHIGASAFVVPDLYASVYAESGLYVPLTEDADLRFDAQFTHQHSVGEELLAGSPFDTWNLGLRTSASFRGAVLRASFVITGDEIRIRSFYGSNPSYASLQQRTFNQADQKTLVVSLSYDFSHIGIEDLSAIASYANGWDGIVDGVVGEEREFDFTLDYRIGKGWLESLWLRLRASYLEIERSKPNGTDFRVILRYDLPVI